jgi:ATP-binding cassette subfamily B protein
VVALLGPTGSGKSTLVNLIPRFYDVSEGAVTIDGVDVREIDLRDLRRQIGFVLQQTLLFSASVRENIAYGKPDATEEEIIAAAKAANADEFVTEFPDGYDTLIGERGVTLSGGQRQRVAIARALLINPRILILDDSTSSVDTKTEARIRDALSYLMAGRTTFIIAQRLNSVQNADQILVLQDGEIIERGKHEELLALDGYYAEIYRLQLEDQERVRRELASIGLLPVNKIRYRQEDKQSTGEYRKVVSDLSGD